MKCVSPVEASNLNCTGGYQFGDQLNCACPYGFVLIGHATLQCTGSGQWTAQIPQCQRKQLHRSVLQTFTVTNDSILQRWYVDIRVCQQTVPTSTYVHFTLGAMLRTRVAAGTIWLARNKEHANNFWKTLQLDSGTDIRHTVHVRLVLVTAKCRTELANIFS